MLVLSPFAHFHKGPTLLPASIPEKLVQAVQKIKHHESLHSASTTASAIGKYFPSSPTATSKFLYMVPSATINCNKWPAASFKTLLDCYKWHSILLKVDKSMLWGILSSSLFTKLSGFVALNSTTYEANKEYCNAWLPLIHSKALFLAQDRLHSIFSPTQLIKLPASCFAQI